MGFLNKSLHVGRLAGDTCNNVPIMMHKSVLYLSGILGYLPLTTFLNNSFMLEALKGGVKQQISYKTIPNDHISDFKS